MSFLSRLVLNVCNLPCWLVIIYYHFISPGVLGHLNMLEMEANNFELKQQELRQRGREEELNATLQALLTKRDQLKVEIKANTVN